MNAPQKRKIVSVYWLIFWFNLSTAKEKNGHSDGLRPDGGIWTDEAGEISRLHAKHRQGFKELWVQ